jgi:hypothetical protein
MILQVGGGSPDSQAAVCALETIGLAPGAMQAMCVELDRMLSNLETSPQETVIDIS